MKAKVTIGSKILLMIAATVALTAVLLSAISFPQFESSIATATKNHLMDQVEAEAGTLQGTLEQFVSGVDDFTDNTTAMNSLAKKNAETYEKVFEKELTEIKEATEGLSDLVLLDAKGNVLAATSESGKSGQYSGLEAVKKAASSAKVQYSGIQNVGSGKESVLLVYPVYKAEKQTGTLVAHISCEALCETMSNCSVTGVNALSAYILDVDGTILAHSDSSKIGSKVEQKELLEVLSLGVTKGDVTYSVEGDTQFAGYYILGENGWLVGFSVSEKEIFAPITAVEQRAYIMILVLSVVICAVAFVITKLIVKPIVVTNKVLTKVAEFDFREDAAYKEYTKKRDETGEMCASICTMTEQLRDEMLHINAVSEQMTATANGMDKIAGAVTKSAENNLESLEEVSASFASTADSAEQIAKEIDAVQTYTEEMGNKIEAGVKKTHSLKERAGELCRTAEEANRTSAAMFAGVKKGMEYAMEKAKSVEKISMFTDAIMEISDQTTLLALNASIEAARAGEAGRGFAVVAGEISNLAKQSTESADNITALVDEIYQAVDALEKCLKESLAYMEEHVIPDYAKFSTVSEEYSEDSTELAKAMEFLREGIREFTDTMDTTVNSVVRISENVQESAKQIQGMEEENRSVTKLIQETYDLVQVNARLSGELKEVVEKYTL